MQGRGGNKSVHPRGEEGKDRGKETKNELTLNVKDEPGPEGAPVEVVVGEPPPPGQHTQHHVHHHPRQRVDDRLHHQQEDKNVCKFTGFITTKDKSVYM